MGLYRQLIGEAEHDREQAETALGDRASARRKRIRRVGILQVDSSLAPGTAMVSFVRYQRYEVIEGKRHGLNKLMGISARYDKEPFPPGGYRLIPSYLAIVTYRDPASDEAPAKGLWAKLKHVALGRPMVNRGIVRLGDAAEIDSLVARWVDAASHGPRRLPPDRADAVMLGIGQALRKRVWDPIVHDNVNVPRMIRNPFGGYSAKGLGACERVYIVPDGALQLINFAALPAADGSYLIEHSPTIHLLSAERDLALAAVSSPAAGRTLLAFGGADFDDACAAESVAAQPNVDPLVSRGATMCTDFRSMRFVPLPATSEEVAEIGREWRAPGASVAGEAVALVGPRACETEFKRLAHGSTVIHVATHGFFIAPSCVRIATDDAAEPSSHETSQTLSSAMTAANPLNLCGLAFTGANRRADALPGADDGILTAQEIAALDLRGTQWAVLSACETGVGEVVSGEGVFGLRRAFQMAGARTLIMSLWSVEDDATRRWMHLLYEARFAKGMSTTDAVRAASLARLAQRRETGLSAHPFYWAAFVAVGDWR